MSEPLPLRRLNQGYAASFALQARLQQLDARIEAALAATKALGIAPKPQAGAEAFDIAKAEALLAQIDKAQKGYHQAVATLTQREADRLAAAQAARQAQLEAERLRAENEKLAQEREWQRQYKARQHAQEAAERRKITRIRLFRFAGWGLFAALLGLYFLVFGGL